MTADSHLSVFIGGALGGDPCSSVVIRLGIHRGRQRRRSMRFAVIALFAALIAPASFAQGTPSVGEDFKEAGRAVGNGVKEGYDKTKDATLRGVGKALDETGKGLDKAGRAVDGAGKKVEDKAE